MRGHLSGTGLATPMDAWSVYEDYRVADGMLMPVGRVVREYDPLQHIDVVIELAKLGPGYERELECFARRLGLLGYDDPQGGPGISDQGAMGMTDVLQDEAPGEPIRWIWAQAANVRLVLEIQRYL